MQSSFLTNTTVALAFWTVVASPPLKAYAQQAVAPETAMDNQRLDRLIKQQFPAESIDGGPGVWRIDLPFDAPNAGDAPPDAEGIPSEDDPAEGEELLGPGAKDHLPPMILVITDEQADRMRIMMPVRRFSPEREEDLRLALIALHANYDRALDARYAVHEGVLWSAFIHPLGSLIPADFENALRQVQALRDNTGTTYSSSEFLFGPGEAPEEGPPDQPQDNSGQPEEDNEDKVV